MTIRKWVAAAALLAVSSGALADVNYEFDSVTSLTVNGTSIIGVLVNDTTPTTLTLSGTPSSCLNWLQLLMTEPGKFTVGVTVTTSGGTFPGDPIYTNISTCRLNAKP